MKCNVSKLTEQLISYPSITPNSAGIIDFIIGLFPKNKFDIHVKRFGTNQQNYTDNIFILPKNYSSLDKGKKKKHLCFSGHLDVVPAGTGWLSDPFIPKIQNDMLYGRGAVDMKGAIAAFITAFTTYMNSPDWDEQTQIISILLTCDEEGNRIYGTKAMLEWLYDSNQDFPLPDICLLGEPTSQLKLCDTFKTARRGSINFSLRITGKQGHVAYPNNFISPIQNAYEFIASLNQKLQEIDSSGMSKCEIISINSDLIAYNIIPADNMVCCNIRHNHLFNANLLQKIILELSSYYSKLEYDFTLLENTPAFHSVLAAEDLSLINNSVSNILGYDSIICNNGGTSDGVFIAKYCPVVELGLLNKTAHQSNECVPIKDLENLSLVYSDILKNFFI